MIHWKTNEEMGSGFKFDKETHKQFRYNILETISKHEYNIMRTKYLIRDWWNLQQLKELKCFVDNEIEYQNILSNEILDMDREI